MRFFTQNMMVVLLSTLIIPFVSMNAAQAISKTLTKTKAKNTILRFADYPASPYKGKRVKPNIANLNALNSFYLQEINKVNNIGVARFEKNLQKSPPNFAGHYIVSQFNCGVNCEAAVAYDVKTGNFMELGGGFASCPATDYNSVQKVQVVYRPDSRLLIIIGATSMGNCVTGYFVENNGNIKQVAQKPLLVFADGQ